MKAAMLWSGGKDSAIALAACLDDPEIEVTCLITTLSKQFDRISMHGVRRGLLEAQAEAIGLPVQIVYADVPQTSDEPPAFKLEGFTSFPSNALYEHHMIEALNTCRDSGVEAVIAGDLFLEDLRAYREALVGKADLIPLFPLWQRDTKRLLADAIETGLKAVTVCIDGERLDRSWAGRWLDADFIAELPEDIDPCGENGEFHTFVTDAPFFSEQVPVDVTDIVYRDPFWFADLKKREAALNS